MSKFNQKFFKSIFIIIPFLLIYVGTAFQNTNASLSSIIKMAGFAYMIVYIIINNKLNVRLLLATLCFMPFVIYGVLNSFNIKAGLSDGIRYFFPIITLYYGYSIRHHLPLIIKFVIAFVLINFFVQIINYINWIRGIDQWFYYETSDGLRYYNESAGIMRATGTVVFFGFFGFFNLISLFLIKEYYSGKFKNILIAICLLGIILSFSYKTIGVFLVILCFYYYKTFIKLSPLIGMGIFAVYVSFPKLINDIIKEIVNRFTVYISEGTSMRAESYRVMFHEIENFNLLGKGIGMFGGPASISYNSPYYQEVYFYWFDTAWLELPTTDTYPPHAFVELGIIGASLYFFLLLIPLFRKKFDKNYAIAIIIYFALFFDMLFSFSLNNLEFLMYSLVFIYPILYTAQRNNITYVEA